MIKEFLESIPWITMIGKSLKNLFWVSRIRDPHPLAYFFRYRIEIHCTIESSAMWHYSSMMAFTCSIFRGDTCGIWYVRNSQVGIISWIFAASGEGIKRSIIVRELYNRARQSKHRELPHDVHIAKKTAGSLCVHGAWTHNGTQFALPALHDDRERRDEGATGRKKLHHVHSTFSSW